MLDLLDDTKTFLITVQPDLAVTFEIGVISIDYLIRPDILN